MIVFLYGNDSFRVNERLTILRDGFRAKYDEDGHNVSAVTGDDFDIDRFRTYTKSAGLFATKRLVVLRHPWKITGEQRDQLLEELDTIDDDTVLIVAGDAPPRKNDKLFKRLEKADLVEPYDELQPQELKHFVEQEAAQFGAQITPGAVQRLVQSVGNDLWRMRNEMKRLAHYTTTIDEGTVDELVDKIIDDNIFQLTDALGARNAANASRLLNEQIELGANEQYLITMLGRHIATLLKVKQTNGEGLKMHPYVMDKAKQQSKAFSQRELLQLYWKLLEIDHSSKSSTSDTHTLLDLFVIDAATA